MHTLAALSLTAFMAAGLAGLGDAARGRTAGDRWVRGWTLLWWPVALVAQFAGPRPAVVVGFLVLGGGCFRVVRRVRSGARPVLGYAVAAAAGAPLWLAPPFFYDTLVYHLGLPWSWLVNDSFSTSAHQVFSHFPLAGQTVFLLPVAAGVPEAAAGLHWITFVVVLATLARLAGDLGAGRWRWLAPALFAACWHAAWVAGVAAVDHLVVLGVVVSVQLLCGALREGSVDWAGVGAGWGLALAAKYPAMMPAAAVGLAALVAFSRERLRLAMAGAMALGLSSFWWIRNAVETGNPIFPLLWRVLGGSGWSLRDDERYQALVREGLQGGTLQTALTRLVVPPDGAGWWLLLALPLAVAAVLRRGETGATPRMVGLASALGLSGWVATAQTTRFALPLIALVAALAAAGLGSLGRRPALLAVGGLSLGVAHGLLTLAAFLAGTLGLDRLLTGSLSGEAWRASVTVDDPMPAYRACARVLPDGARVLVVGEGRPWGCPRPHLVSSPYDHQLMQEIVEASSDPAGVARRVRERGFTHLLIRWSELERLGGPDYRALRFEDRGSAERWRAFLGGCTSRVWSDGGLEIRSLGSTCASLTVERSGPAGR